ncbi:putative ABC transport system ATP-binding protein [Streptococcus sp. 45]|jgi:putative ABC transport system ATP-binding protein|uniref:ABC transport system ATP-binding protein n=2 Tax=Streptococcus equinus TaxID=1335 RepID=A0A091BQY6_STREI|nr:MULTISPECIES: ABC transporter ATP-binding protein [Streptococcus]KFN88086.1 arginine ABC transporter ATP-binding protein [Streptococcus equinus JB1]SDQ23603.1 putative ABC transport system ATP-binding protein [Streptococcus equinus]SDW57134.1 putative ABC transport system ATP-binding protein [Streptococcus equinus]SEI45161.1 putative ABC transport system ATP-binding protein [Streptococcus sp. 45]SFL04619.1 putative ABC transport system ATP-binding protein [Streptococcus equinus JB1]
MITFQNISKIYQVGDQEVKALDDVSFSIEKGKFTIILGPSGSGKSTMLNLLGGMDQATSGKFLFEDTDVTGLSDKDLSKYRKDVVGFVFQFYNLVPSLTALENISIAAQLTKNAKQSEQYLEKVGLSHRKNNFPNQLSGGEMQRVSIARALAKKPKLLLCDEPTGALDSKTGQKIIELLKETSADKDVAVVMVTHNAEFEKYADKVIYLKDGKIDAIVNKDAQNG